MQTTQRRRTTAPSVFWGVDSLEPVDQAFFDAVRTRIGVPAFWGRYIGRQGNLTPDEVSLLHKNACKVLVIFRDTGSGQLTTRAQAGEQAKSAIAFAHDLGIPGGVWIYADTEYPSQSPTAEWFAGWFETLQGSPYGAGVYGNTSPQAAPKFGAAFCQAYPSAPDPARAYIYASQIGLPPGAEMCDPSYRTFSPPIPPCHPPVVIHQYTTGTGLGCPVPATEHLVDYDLATAAGLASMC